MRPMNFRKCLIGIVFLVLFVPQLAQAVVIYGSFTSTTGPVTRYDTETDVTDTLAEGPGNMALSFDSSGNLFGLAGYTSVLYSIDPATGVATAIGSGSYDGGPEGMTFDLAGRMLASGGGDLFEVNTATGSATSLVTLSGIGDIDGLTVNPVAVNSIDGLIPAGTLFAIDSGDLFTIDVGTGVATLMHSGVDASETIAFAPDGTLYGNSGSGGNYYIIDLVSGAGTLVGGPGVWGSAVGGPSVPVEPVPAFGTTGTLLTLLALALVGGMYLRRHA